MSGRPPSWSPWPDMNSLTDCSSFWAHIIPTPRTLLHNWLHKHNLCKKFRGSPISLTKSRPHAYEFIVCTKLHEDQHASRVELNIKVKQKPLEDDEHSEPGTAKNFGRSSIGGWTEWIPNISSSLNFWCLDKQLFSDHFKVVAGLSLTGVKSSANAGKLQIYDHWFPRIGISHPGGPADSFWAQSL